MTGVPVLVVDDEPQIQRLLRTSLTAQGYEVREAMTGRAALTALAVSPPDLVILDLGLPDIDGIELLRRIRARDPHLPVVVLSSRGDEHGKVEALNLGADDYVTKPFGMAELVARLRTALRHRYQAAGAEPIFTAGEVRVDLTRRLVHRAGEEVKLSPKEFDILRLMVSHAGRVLTHRFLMNAVWGAAGDVQYLRVYIRQLRHKLEADPGRPALILTETGVGYRLAEEASAA